MKTEILKTHQWNLLNFMSANLLSRQVDDMIYTIYKHKLDLGDEKWIQ